VFIPLQDSPFNFANKGEVVNHEALHFKREDHEYFHRQEFQNMRCFPPSFLERKTWSAWPDEWTHNNDVLSVGDSPSSHRDMTLGTWTGPSLVAAGFTRASLFLPAGRAVEPTEIDFLTFFGVFLLSPGFIILMLIVADIRTRNNQVPSIVFDFEAIFEARKI